MAVLPYSRAGITGGAMLGLGRAIGETIAVVLVIGNSPTLGHSIFQQGYTLAAVIANEFGEAAATPVHRSALFAAGLVLFVLTLIVNIVARRLLVVPQAVESMLTAVAPVTEPGTVEADAASATSRHGSENQAGRDVLQGLRLRQDMTLEPRATEGSSCGWPSRRRYRGSPHPLEVEA